MAQSHVNVTKSDGAIRFKCYRPDDHVIKLWQKFPHHKLLCFETILLVQQVERMEPLIKRVVESKMQ